MQSSVNVKVNVLKLGESYIGATTLGGITIRGSRADSINGAIRNVLYTVANQSTDDAAIALELELAGETMDTALLEASKDADALNGE